PRSRENAKLAAHIEEELAGPLKTARKRKVDRVIGTSGTLLALVSMAAHRMGVHPGRDAHGLEVPAAALGQIRRELVRTDRAGRLAMRGMDLKRSELIVAGAVLTDEI